MGGAIPTVVTVIGAGVGTVVGALVGGGGGDESDVGGDRGDGDDEGSDGGGAATGARSASASVTSAGTGSSANKKSSTRRGTSPLHEKPHQSEKDPTQTQKSLPSVDESKYLAVVNPYPLNANLELYEDQRALVLWLACCAGKEVSRAMFYSPSVSSSKHFFVLPLISPTTNPPIPQSSRKWSLLR